MRCPRVQNWTYDVKLDGYRRQTGEYSVDLLSRSSASPCLFSLETAAFIGVLEST